MQPSPTGAYAKGAYNVMQKQAEEIKKLKKENQRLWHMLLKEGKVKDGHK